MGKYSLRSEYLTWYQMNRRCTDPTNPRFPRYGGRGISVCERWQSFRNFYADMGPRPSPDHSLDRINNDGSYSPDNCRWVTRLVQQHNSSHTVLTAETVAAIRTEHAAGVLGYKNLGRKYGVTGANIRRVVKRQTWTHV
jgi:hypothetical protein